MCIKLSIEHSSTCGSRTNMNYIINVVIDIYCKYLHAGSVDILYSQVNVTE